MQTILQNGHATNGIFIEADIQQPEHIAVACRAALDALAHIQARYPTEHIGMTIAFGANFWQKQPHAAEAPDLKNFPAYGSGEHLAPATQHDLLIHIQSNSHDSNLSLAMNVLAAFGNAITVVNETHGFRRHEERGWDGFVDGTENPQGDTILPTACNEHGGSYVLLQRYRHNLAQWNAHSIAEQEEAVARSKETNEAFPKSERHPRSHIARTNLKENGVGLKIVRRSLPYGTASGEQGLAFIAYAAKLHNIEAQLQHMFGDAADGLTDLLLERLATAISGAYYYAPSAERLRNL